MYEKLIQYLMKRPEAYEPGEPMFWNDPHISKGMLAAHLNPDIDSATRKLDFVRRSADWIAQTTDKALRPRLLDLGCGPGIYAELLYRKGFDVTGIDLSPRSVAYARKRAAAQRMDIRYLCQSYLDMDFDRTFDVITLIYCDFGVLSGEDRKRLLGKVYGALKPGGMFIVDVCTMKQYEGWEEKSTWSCSDGGFWSAAPYACLYSFRYYDRRIILEQYVVAEKDRVRCFNIWNHGFTAEELEADLMAAGFTAARFYGDVTGEPLTEACRAICAVACKA